MSWIETTLPWTAPAAAWMLTYLLHSTVLLALAAAATLALRERRAALQEVIWKCALVGGLATATLQVGLGWAPLAGSWELPGTAVERSARTTEAAAPIASPAEPAVGGAAIVARDVARDAGAADRTALPAAVTTASRLAAPTAATAEGVGVPAPTRAAPAWPLLALAAWLAVAALLAGRLAFDYLRLTARLRERWPVADGAVAALFGRLLGKSGRRRPVALTGSERLPVPIAWGLARPEVSLPARVLRDLSPYHQESILAHELAHVLRRDPAWLAAARLLEAVLFFQPLNRLARRRLQEIAEYRCDDRAVELTGRPLELARCLTEVATWRLAGLVSLPVPSMASGSSLGRRVRRLVQRVDHPGEGGEPLPRWVRPAAVAAVLAVALAAPGVTRGKPAPQEPGAAPAAASPAAAAEADAAEREARQSEDENGGWVIVDDRSWDELTPAERDEVRRDVAAARRDAARAGREAREHAREALEQAREQLRHQRDARRLAGDTAHLADLDGLAGLIGGSVRLGLTAASAALAALDMPAIEEEVARAMAEVERELAREMPRIEAEMAAAMADVARELAAEMPRIQAEVAAAMAEAERELAAEMPRIEAEIERALAEVERELEAMEAEIEAEDEALELEEELQDEPLEAEEIDEP